MTSAPKEQDGAPEQTPQLRDVAADVKAEGQKLASDAKDAIADMAVERKKAAADYMQAMAAAIECGAGELERRGRSGTASLVRRTSGELRDVSQRVLDRDPRLLLHEIEEFVRHRPGLSLGITAVVGFGLMRFFKSSGDASGTGQRG